MLSLFFLNYLFSLLYPYHPLYNIFFLFFRYNLAKKVKGGIMGSIKNPGLCRGFTYLFILDLASGEAQVYLTAAASVSVCFTAGSFSVSAFSDVLPCFWDSSTILVP